AVGTLIEPNVFRPDAQVHAGELPEHDPPDHEALPRRVHPEPVRTLAFLRAQILVPAGNSCPGGLIHARVPDYDIAASEESRSQVVVRDGGLKCSRGCRSSCRTAIAHSESPHFLGHFRRNTCAIPAHSPFWRLRPDAVQRTWNVT